MVDDGSDGVRALRTDRLKQPASGEHVPQRSREHRSSSTISLWKKSSAEISALDFYIILYAKMNHAVCQNACIVGKK